MKASRWSPSPWDLGTVTATSSLTEPSSIIPEGRHGNSKPGLLFCQVTYGSGIMGPQQPSFTWPSKGLHLFMICQCLAFDCTF